MVRGIGEKIFLFIVLFAILVMDSWKLVAISIPLGIISGTILGVTYAREHLYVSIRSGLQPHPPRWMIRIAGEPPTDGWKDTKRWAIILGGVTPVALLIFQLYTDGSWDELSFPISMLSAWVISICVLICATKVKWH